MRHDVPRGESTLPWLRFTARLALLAFAASLAAGGCGGGGVLPPVTGGLTVEGDGGSDGASGDGSGTGGGASGGEDSLSDGGSAGGSGGAEAPEGAVGDDGDYPPVLDLEVRPAGPLGPGDELTLDASLSYDPERLPLTFEWRQISGPSASLSGATTAQAAVRLPLAVDAATVRFAVRVRDRNGAVVEGEIGATLVVPDQFAGFPQSLAPYRDQLTADEAYHLLRRAAFGASPEVVALAVQRGLSSTIDDLLTIKPVPPAVEALAASYENKLPQRWITNMIEGPNPLLERMTLLWHDRFPVNDSVLIYPHRNLSVQHLEALRADALGNYRDLLHDLTSDPMVLRYMDIASNQNEGPNENYAREFWEQYALGTDVLYEDADVGEAARAFTGLSYDVFTSGAFGITSYDPADHDSGLKTIFPSRAGTANHDYQSVVELTLAQPEAARFVASNLFRFFVHDEPDGAVIDELAGDLVAGGFEIAPLVRKLLRSRAMFSPQARFCQVSSPVEHVIGVARTLGVHLASADSQGYTFNVMVLELEKAGQKLFASPDVHGWDDGEAWLNDQWLLWRVACLGRLLDMEFGPDLTPELPLHLLPPTSTWNQAASRRQIVDALAAVFRIELADEERGRYLDLLDDIAGSGGFHTATYDRQEWAVTELIKLIAMDERVITR
jgi:uncharacterized protein (DUF1800 family)